MAETLAPIAHLSSEVLTPVAQSGRHMSHVVLELAHLMVEMELLFCRHLSARAIIANHGALDDVRLLRTLPVLADDRDAVDFLVDVTA